MPLNDRQIRNAKPAEKPYKLADGHGLYLQITPAGGKLWRMKYRIDGKEKLLSIGKYPAVSLSDHTKKQSFTVCFFTFTHINRKSKNKFLKHFSNNGEIYFSDGLKK